MTNPSLSWIDRARFSALLENATLAADPKAISLPSAPARAPAPALAKEASPRGAPSTPPVSSTRDALPPAFEPPRGPLEERLQAFFEWVLRSVPCSGAFIADEHGLPLIQRGVMQPTIAFSSSLLDLLESFASLEGEEDRWLSVGVSRDAVLHLCDVRTAWGHFGVGILAGSSLRPEVLGVVQQGLARAFME